MSAIPELRIEAANDRPVRRDGKFVLYWMIAARRTHWNYALQRAAEWANRLARPLLVLEALRCGYRWASDRLHRFILDGMRTNAARLRGSGAQYYPYVEPRPGAGRGLLKALAQQACVVVTDDYPCGFLPGMVAAAARQVYVRLETVDSNGLLPLRDAPMAFSTAYAFRRHLQRVLPFHLERVPQDDPLVHLRHAREAEIPGQVLSRWPPASEALLAGAADALAALPIDHSVGVTRLLGGSVAALAVWRRFLSKRLPNYAQGRSHPDDEASSGLSPWLHFGHIGAHQLFSELAGRDGWTPARLAGQTSGSKSGWWGMSEPAEAFLDELVTWRELGMNFCVRRDDYDQYDSLPDWAQRTLAAHSRDPREWIYTPEEFAAAETHDPVWNAAQRQLARDGVLHNYMRMLWGKKIIEWTRTPREALAVMIELNNRYALDGRDPNSYSGIFWCLGRYDRPWGPERPIFGLVRYMSSESALKKLRMKRYLERYGGEPAASPAPG